MISYHFYSVKFLNEDPSFLCKKPLEKMNLNRQAISRTYSEVVKDKEKTEQVFYAAKDLSHLKKKN